MGSSVSPEAPQRAKVMVTLGGGGHLWESLSLIRQLSTDYEVTFLTSHGSLLPEGELFSPERAYRITDIASIGRHGIAHRVVGVCRGMLDCISALRAVRPDAVIGVGTALSVPLLAAARILRIRTAFIESITRVDGLSKTGRLVHRLRLADVVYVQWPDCADPGSGITYAGTVL